MSNQPPHDPSRTPRFELPSTVASVHVPPTEPIPARDGPQPTVSMRPADALVGLSVARDAVPGYEVLEEIGRGGMGVVYKARQVQLNRIVALKMILGGPHAAAADLTRFQVEAQTVARVHHANIVQIYEIGWYNGIPYLALEYCGGGTLAGHLKNQPLAGHEAAALVEPIARAMHAAHQAGIVHRDLKPANILLQVLTTEDTEERRGKPGEDKKEVKNTDRRAGAVATSAPSSASSASSVVNLVPKLTDFGLAKQMQGGQGLTHTGEVMGTPSYMAPEQASGDTHRIGPACDIYGLGAILYELITGRPPFLADNHVDTVLQVLNQEPLPPRMLNRKIDADLERITLKCLEKHPTRRYGSALELAEDLQRYQQGEPVSARSVNLLERLHRELAHSQYDAHLRPWGKALIALGIIIFAAQLGVTLLLEAGLPWAWAFWVPRVITIVALAYLFSKYRPTHSLWPSNSVERLIWAVWVGYILTFSSLFWVMQVQGHDHLHIYGPMAAVSGLAWFAMGGHVWGGCYLIGLGFLVLAPIIALTRGSPLSPLWFGVVWSAALLIMGWRYVRLGRQS